jgi:hypothetical protein
MYLQEAGGLFSSTLYLINIKCGEKLTINLKSTSDVSTEMASWKYNLPVKSDPKPYHSHNIHEIDFLKLYLGVNEAIIKCKWIHEAAMRNCSCN